MISWVSARYHGHFSRILNTRQCVTLCRCGSKLGKAHSAMGVNLLRMHSHSLSMHCRWPCQIRLRKGSANPSLVFIIELCRLLKTINTVYSAHHGPSRWQLFRSTCLGVGTTTPDVQSPAPSTMHLDRGFPFQRSHELAVRPGCPLPAATGKSPGFPRCMPFVVSWPCNTKGQIA